MKIYLISISIFFISLTSWARVRDLGIQIGEHKPGKLNSITDVEGVRVGQVTLTSGNGPLVMGKGPVRTGVTVVLPTEGDIWNKKMPAGSFVLNGNGEAMGLMWIQESGILETPIALTNTLSVASVQRGLLDWMTIKNPKIGVSDDTLTPVVLECDDSSLNDIRGQHVLTEHVLEAIKNASKEVSEGGVGAGTGMISYEFKGGIGTSSRVLSKGNGGYTVGVLLNANHGRRKNLRILGVNIGEQIKDLLPKMKQEGSVVVIIATDAPLDARQLSRMAKRAMLGIGRTGATAYHGSGDVAIAFSTANRIPHYPKERTSTWKILSDFHINPLFEAVSDASEEAILNALFAAETVTGRDGNTVYGIPKDRLKKLLGK